MEFDQIYGTIDNGFGNITETNKYSYLVSTQKSDVSGQIKKAQQDEKTVESLINQKYAQRKAKEPQSSVGSGKTRKFLFRAK